MNSVGKDAVKLANEQFHYILFIIYETLFFNFSYCFVKKLQTFHSMVSSQEEPFIIIVVVYKLLITKIDKLLQSNACNRQVFCDAAHLFETTLATLIKHKHASITFQI